jgi:rod shape-determining protein MreD
VLYLTLIIAVAVAVLLEGYIPLYWGAFRYVDLFLIVTLYFGLMRNPVLGMVAGCVAGLCGDLAPGAGPIVGVGGFAKTLIGFLVATVAVRFSLEGPLVRVAVLAVSSIVNTALYIGLHGLLGEPLVDTSTAESAMMKVAFEAAANLVGGVVIFWIFDKLFPEQAAGGQMRVRRRFYD